LDSEDNIRVGIDTKKLDFWFRPSSTGAFPSRSYGQRYAHVDSQIIRPRSSVWEWGYVLQAAVSSEGIDLMIRALGPKLPSQDWVSDELDHLQRLTEIVFCFRGGCLHRPKKTLYQVSGRQLSEMANPLPLTHRVLKQKGIPKAFLPEREEDRSHRGHRFRTRLKCPHLSRLLPLMGRKQAWDRVHNFFSHIFLNVRLSYHRRITCQCLCH
jgi:hypothetical protein